MKFIKELKGKKKNENIPLVCKICRDKTFTATATLMYHYRSHAGNITMGESFHCSRIYHFEADVL